MPRRSRRVGRPRRSRNEIVFHRGHKITVPNHPTDFCAQPWFPLVVRINNPATVKFSDLYSAIVSQLNGLSFANSALMVRLLSIRLWGPIPTTNAVLRMVVKDVFDDTISGAVPGAQVVLEVIENYADQVNRARVGYVYSTAQQQKGLFCINGANDDIITTAGAGTGSVAYIQLLWRPTAGVVRQSDVNKLTKSLQTNMVIE